MGESTNTLLYTATYVFIFVIATSLSIVLYLSVNRYADRAFEYKEGMSGSIINSASTGLEEYKTGQTPLTKDDVFSYFVNYIKNDLYGTNKEGENIRPSSGYNVTINEVGINSDDTYKQAYDKIATYDKYYIQYKTTSDDGIKEVVISPLITSEK